VDWIDLAVDVDVDRGRGREFGKEQSVSIKCGESDVYLRHRWLLKKGPCSLELVRFVLHFNIITEVLLRF
jgi:hypothetical protein